MKRLVERLAEEEIKTILPNVDTHVDGWLTYCKALPRDNEKVSPDFKQFDETYFDLFDEEKFNMFINQCTESIEKMWNHTV